MKEDLPKDDQIDPLKLELMQYMNSLNFMIEDNDELLAKAQEESQAVFFCLKFQ